MPKIEATIITPNQHTANGNIIGMNMIITPIKAIVPKPSASPTFQASMVNIYNISLEDSRLRDISFATQGICSTMPSIMMISTYIVSSYGVTVTIPTLSHVSQ